MHYDASVFGWRQNVIHIDFDKLKKWVNYYEDRGFLCMLCFGNVRNRPTYEISSESWKEGNYFAESTRIWNNIAVGMSRIIFEVWNEFVVAVKRLELSGVYVGFSECWSSAEAGNFTIFSEYLSAFKATLYNVGG